MVLVVVARVKGAFGVRCADRTSSTLDPHHHDQGRTQLCRSCSPEWSLGRVWIRWGMWLWDYVESWISVSGSGEQKVHESVSGFRGVSGGGRIGPDAGRCGAVEVG